MKGLCFVRFIAGPCAHILHIQAEVSRRAQPNAVLEKVFTSISKVPLIHLFSFSFCFIFRRLFTPFVIQLWMLSECVLFMALKLTSLLDLGSDYPRFFFSPPPSMKVWRILTSFNKSCRSHLASFHKAYTPPTFFFLLCRTIYFVCFHYTLIHRREKQHPL